MYTIASSLLCSVERLVRGMHQSSDSGSLRSAGTRDSEAAGDVQILAFGLYWRNSNRLTQALSQISGLFPVAVRQHDQELLATIAAHMIVGAYTCVQPAAG